MPPTSVSAQLAFPDHRADPGAWARDLGISREARRPLPGERRHRPPRRHASSGRATALRPHAAPRGGLFDAPLLRPDRPAALREARVTGALWFITTNPLRTAAGRARAFGENFARLRETLAACPDDVALVPQRGRLRAARAAGKHAAFIAVQGGNAFDGDAATLERAADRRHPRHPRPPVDLAARHESCPVNLRRGEGLTPLGLDLRQLTRPAHLRRPRAHPPARLLRRRRGARPHPAAHRQPHRRLRRLRRTGATSTTSSSAPSPTPAASSASCTSAPSSGEGPRGRARAASSITSSTS